MDKKELGQLLKSVNSVGYKLYFSYGIDNFLEENGEKVSTVEKNNDVFLFISKKNYKPINFQNVPLLPKDMSYGFQCLQEISKQTEIHDKFHLSINYYFDKTYWNFFLPYMLKTSKSLFPEGKLPIFSDMINNYNFQEIVKIYAAAPISTHHQTTAEDLYEYIADQDYSILKTVDEESLAKIFLKTKKIHSFIDVQKASHFEHFFSNPDIIDKIKDHSRFLVENDFSLEHYISNIDTNPLNIQVDIQFLQDHLSLNDANIVKATHKSVFLAIAKFYNYEYEYEAFPRKGLSSFYFASNDDTKVISVKQFWDDVNTVYQTALKKNMEPSKISTSVPFILEHHILNELIPNKPEIVHKVKKF